MANYINKDGIDRVLRRLEREMEAEKAEKRNILSSKIKIAPRALQDAVDNAPNQPGARESDLKSTKRTLLDLVDDTPDHGDMHRANSRQNHHDDQSDPDNEIMASFEATYSRALPRFQTMSNSELLKEIDKGLSTIPQQKQDSRPAQKTSRTHQIGSHTPIYHSISNSAFLGQQTVSPTANVKGKSVARSNGRTGGNDTHASLSQSDASLSSSTSSGMGGMDAKEVEKEIKSEAERRRREQFLELRRIMVPSASEWRWWEAGLDLVGRVVGQEGARARGGEAGEGAGGQGDFEEGASSRAKYKEGAARSGRRQEDTTGCEVGNKAASHVNRMRVPDGKVRLNAGNYIAFNDDEDGSWCLLEYC